MLSWFIEYLLEKMGAFMICGSVCWENIQAFPMKEPAFFFKKLWTFCKESRGVFFIFPEKTRNLRR